MRQKSYRVLVVDDDAATLYAVSRGLAAEGYATIQAKTGAECLGMAADVQAIVLDVHLPDVFGLEVCRLLRSRGFNGPVVCMSAKRISTADEEAARTSGADDYLTAPVDPVELALRLDHLLRQGNP